jgi:hypothetical protein
VTLTNFSFFLRLFFFTNLPPDYSAFLPVLRPKSGNSDYYTLAELSFGYYDFVTNSLGGYSVSVELYTLGAKTSPGKSPSFITAGFGFFSLGGTGSKVGEVAGSGSDLV